MTSKTDRTKRTLFAAAAGGLLLCAGSLPATAASVTQPGETVGIAAGAPLPQGLYFVNTFDWGRRENVDLDLGVDIPLLAWSTPWTIWGARLQFLAATPILEVNPQIGPTHSGFYNPLISGQLAWDLGNGFGFSYLLGAYIDVDTNVAWSSTSINQRFGFSYTGNDWNLTANIIWGIQLDRVTDRPQLSPCPVPLSLNGCNPDFLNIDLTATKKFGKWEIGPVAYYSTDLTSPTFNYQKQSQFAVGGLIGYDFDVFTVQAYVTTEVHEDNYGGKDTRGWARIILPLWKPPATPPAPLVRKS